MPEKECRIDFVDGSDEARCLTHNLTLKRERPTGMTVIGLPTDQFNCPHGSGPVPVPRPNPPKPKA